MSSLALCSTKNFNSWLWHLVLYFTFVFAFVFGSAGCLSLPRSTQPPRTSIAYLGASRPSPSPLGLLRPKQTLCLEEPTTTLMHQQHQRNRASCMETTEYIQITHQLLHRTNFTKHHPALVSKTCSARTTNINTIIVPAGTPPSLVPPPGLLRPFFNAHQGLALQQDFMDLRPFRSKLTVKAWLLLPDPFFICLVTTLHIS